MSAIDGIDTNIFQPENSQPAGGGFDFGSFFGALGQIGSAAFNFGSNYVASTNGQPPSYGNSPVIYQQIPQQQQQQQNTQAASTTMIIAIVLVFLIVIGLIAFAIAQSKYKPA